MSFVFELLIGVILGSVLGLLGGGGALFTIPVLIYIFHFPLRLAIGTSLFLVTLGALPAVVLYYFKRQIHGVPALFFGLSGAIGATVGSYLSEWVPTQGLYLLLLLMMGLSAFFMMSPIQPKASEHPPPPWVLVLPGGLIGLLTGLIGVGGGFLIVPTLYFLSKIEPRQAIATSLAIIVINSLFGTLGYWDLLPFQSHTVLILAVGSLIGSMAGFWYSFKLSQMRLKQAFGILLVLLMGLLALMPPV